MSVFFFDNDISFRIANALRELVHDDEILALREKFDVSAKDTEWLPEAGKRGWIVVSRDAMQRRRDPERRAVAEHGVRVFYVRYSPAQGSLFVDAARIIRNWPKISSWGKTAKPGAVARLSTKDIIEVLRSGQ